MSFNFTLDDLPHLLVMVVIASLLGWLAALIAGGRVLLGFVGTVGFGLLGAWLANDIIRPRIPLKLPQEPSLDGVMLVTASLGAIFFALLWCSLTGRFSRR